MATIRPITTGEITTTATGAVTGTLDTSAITGNYSFHVRVRDLTAGKKLIIALEDTASATPFSDAVAVATFHFEGTGVASGGYDNASEQERQWFEIPATLMGGANNKLRVNVIRIGSSATCFVDAWLDT